MSPASHAATVTTLFRFRDSATQERDPESTLVVLNGALYGTARNGGAAAAAGHGGGTVFRIDLSTGAETTLTSFAGGARQGFDPDAGLVADGGKLYGTTAQGNGTVRGSGGIDEGFGTVFRVDPATGKQTILHGFNGADGSQPSSSLVIDGGDFYGTTWFGGAANAGTVFKVDDTGRFTTLYQFPDPAHGCQPVTGVVREGGTLYGATKACGPANGGTVYALDLVTGAQTVLYAFAPDANRPAEPSGKLLSANGALYGTTLYGGTDNKGTVFRIDLPGGKYTLLHSFSGSDGKYPPSGVILHDGLLYGVTEAGGADDMGTIFTVNPSTGAETVAYSFEGTQGDTPFGGLLAYGGAFYGTTINQFGDYRGTVFKLTP